MEKEKLTVLVVDDQKINREILKGILRREYNVLEAADGAQALEVLRGNGNVSAILTDIVMPVMDGYAFLTQLQDSPFASIPTIAMTGEKDETTEQKTLDLGAWDFVSKPYQPVTLMTRLKNVIVRSQFYLLNEMKHIYEHDPLTGLYNRAHFFEQTRALLDDNPDTTFAMVRFDIDHFQSYNSFWGEEEGDRLLRFIADRLREHAKLCTPCTFARITADVYCICAPYNAEAIRVFAESSRDQLAEYNPEFRLAPSFGVYIIDDPQEKIQKMYELVTLAAKACKGSYLTYLSYYRPEMSAQVLRNQWIVNEMQGALDSRQFEVWLQPKYNLVTEQPYGAEALVRWRHPEKGLLSPALFVPVFEQNGFIGKIDFFMWESVCRLLRKWIDEGQQPGPISVNVSRVNMYNPNLVSSFVGLVRKYAIPAGLLHLEVTESAYMDSPDVMEKTIRALQDAGFVILMDDFGSGYSSLNTLKDIHVNVLKIDMKFLSGDSEGERSRSILASAIRMAGWLDMPVIMEGVETAEQVEFLRSIGCSYAQGYYYAKPMPVADYEALTADSRQSPSQSHSENLRDIAEILWSASSANELLLDSMDCPAAVCQQTGGRIYCLRVNESFQRLFGRGYGLESRLELGEQPCMTADGTSSVRELFARAIATKSPCACRFTVRPLDGPPQEFSLSLRYWGRNEEAIILFAQFRVLS